MILAAVTTATVPATQATAQVAASWADILIHYWYWWLLAALSLFLSALYSGVEVGIYSLSRLRLRLRTYEKDPAALQLETWLQTPNYALVGLLILQNLASFGFSASVAGILAARGFGEVGQAIISVIIITPIVLIFCEIVPKDLFRTHADRWVFPMVPPIKWSFLAITWIPLLPIVRGLSFITFKIARQSSPPTSTSPWNEMMTLFEESTASGAITSSQHDLVQRALRMATVNIRDVMVPWNRVVGIPITIGQEGFNAMARRYDTSRLPVLGRSTTDVLGIVEVLEVLGDLQPYNLRNHLRPAMTLIAEQSVRSAITLMRRARQTMAIVLDRQNRAVGLVTMKDLVEELVGELAEW
jgi:putative hemolysin